jgi:putative copper resistance protein D
LALFLDLFGYLSIIVHGLGNAAQAGALGAVLFQLLLARPLGPAIGAAGPAIASTAARIGGGCALGLAVCTFLELAMQAAMLVGTVEISLPVALGATSSLAMQAKILAALALAGMQRRRDANAIILLALGGAILVAATLTTHAAARLHDRGALLVVSALHQLGAAIWIGGLPCFLLALRQADDAARWRLIGARYSRMSMAGVGAIVFSGIGLSLSYIGSWQGLYGAAYGVMVGAKIAMLLMLLGLGAGNFLLIARLRRDPATPITRLRRFTEVEIGIGLTIFFAAASLTSVPPAIDIPAEQASWQEIAARNAPAWPRLSTPSHDALALPALQAKLDAEERHAQAFVPGGGQLPPRNAADIAWSEYNHAWSGIFVGLIGLLALAERCGLRAARHWPLVFLGLAGFLLLRSDPEVWPMGHEGFWESLRDVEVLQHRLAALLVALFGIFEWRVRAGGLAGGWAAYVFPMVCVLGGALLLAHSHAISDVKEALLIEISHTPLALAGIVAGWARWLELRLDGPGQRIAGWVWPVALLVVGLSLLGYREA